MTLPYENATTGKRAVAEMQNILRGFGAERFGVMDDYAAGEVILQFTHRGRNVTMRASTKGYAAAWLKAYPWSRKRARSEAQHKAEAMRIGQAAVYSILRDWLKGQVTPIEVGLMSFEAAFLPNLITGDGRSVMERIEAGGLLALPPPS